MRDLRGRGVCLIDVPGQLLHRRIISGSSGVITAPIRGVLFGLELIYGVGVRARNRYYDRLAAPTKIGVPVISVGNITTGGTGKTPFVIELIQRLDILGRSPAVVSRGYGSEGGAPNDETRLLGRHCPATPCVDDPDRIRGCETAHRRYGADVIVLDDAFQHRRIARDLDIVLIDATVPFGYGHLLPRGLLREPLRGLTRADVVVVTRCNHVSATALARIDDSLRSAAPGATLLHCDHSVIGFERTDGSPIADSPVGRRAIVFAGIGNPQAFVETVKMAGVDVVGTRFWRDHHRYRRSDIDALLTGRGFAPHDIMVTTEKDAVKLADIVGLDHANIVVVRAGIDFRDDGGTMLDDILERVVGHDEGDGQRQKPVGR